jgi:hypothetical protein
MPRRVAEYGQPLRQLWETPDGRWWVPRGESYDLFVLLAEWGSDLYRSAGVMVQPGDVVLDCGAHVGVFTRKALRAGARKVIAIEPVPSSIECLRRNAALEPRSNCVVAYPKGVWNKDDFLVMPEGGALSGGFLKAGEPAARSIKLPLTTIAKFPAITIARTARICLPSCRDCSPDTNTSASTAIASSASGRK